MVKLKGRPLKFETADELRSAIQEYLDETSIENYTVTGLCLAIGTNKQVLLDYEKRIEYKDIVNEAKLIVENAYELSLRKNGRTGDIFALKNFGWRDQGNIDITSDGQKIDSGITTLLATADKIANTITGKYKDE